MINPVSITLANRSFLYSCINRSPNNQQQQQQRQSFPTTNKPTIGDKKMVYATFDTLGLKLHQLDPSTLVVDSEQEIAAHEEPIKTKPDTLPKPKSGKGNRNAVIPTPEPVEIAVTGSPLASKKSDKHLQAFDSESDNANESGGSLERTKQIKKTQQATKEPKKKEKKSTFTKNVLEYVPMTSRRYHRKSPKLFSKSTSLKSLNNDNSNDCGNGTLKSRRLSREELKYVTISLPSNFVHVATATRDNLLPNTPLGEAKLKLNTHKVTYADLRIGPPEYANLIHETEDSTGHNGRFSWDKTLKMKEGTAKVDEEADDRGDYECVRQLSILLEKYETESKVSHQQKEDDENKERKQQQQQQPQQLEISEETTGKEEDDHVYDDVIPLSLRTAVNEPQENETIINFVDDVYEDVEVFINKEEPVTKSASQDSVKHKLENHKEQVDDAVYDDVNFIAEVKNKNNRESINSLYVRQNTCNDYEKDSEWEDFGDLTIYDNSGTKIEETNHPIPCKKKFSSQRRSRKVRGHRSRASRKSSSRSSSSCTKNRPKNSKTVPNSSDDSTYEALETYEPDDFSSDSEAEGSSPAIPQEPPSRPVPPPPREASRGHTFGRRMKILRRTWSLTKGSLGRIRRRTSAECEDGLQQAMSEINPKAQHNHNNNHLDVRKYFSLTKHFKKNRATCLSTFYLDKTDSSTYQEAGLYKAQQKTKGDEAAIDRFNVLAEEPLYQFYTAAATKVAFESDSDTYEEVGKLTVSLVTTTNLAKPGQRTLWCQTPQVINSGLLQTLTAEERKIQEAKFEILTSEASYLNSLRVVENEFASNHELVHDVLDSGERESLFGKVPGVLVASERFLAELESMWLEDLMLGHLSDLLLEHAQRISDIYVDYCSNQVNIDATLKDLKATKGSKFLEAVSRIEARPACQSLSLYSFLILPLQRVTRLPLLADAVLSKLTLEHSERLNWEAVLMALNHIVNKCNEGARLAERRNQMNALAKKLQYPTKVPPVDLRDRELIRSGNVVHLTMKNDTEYKLTFCKKFQKTPLMLMLLTDYLLITKVKLNSIEESYSVIDTCKRSLIALESASEDSPFAGKHAMVLTLLENHAARQIEYVLTCENDTEKERWLDAVSPPKTTCVGETLYESWDCPQVMAVYSHAPSQPDELALQPGDVINVLRKMNDGWLFGEKLLDGEQGWFPGNFTKEVASEHVRARNLRQRHRFLALSGCTLRQTAKQ